MSKVKVVCFGGGAGLSTLLLGLKKDKELDVTAVVTMFDSGGSSGQLKDKFGVLPSGDIARCVFALSKYDQVTREILLQRVNPNPTSNFPGHTFANLLMVMLEKELGGYQEAVDTLCNMFSAQGRVLPVTLISSTLCAKIDDSSTVRTEVEVDQAIKNGHQIRKLYLEPTVVANLEVLKALRSSDVICIGPGSFYTSILPNFLPRSVSDAISSSKAPIIYVMNLMTEGLGMMDHHSHKFVEILEDYLDRSVRAVIVNTNIPQDRLADYAQEGKFPIDGREVPYERYIKSRLWLEGSIARHDPDRLAFKISEVIDKLLHR